MDVFECLANMQCFCPLCRDGPDDSLNSFSGTWKEDPSQSVDPVNPNKVLTYRRNPDGSMTQTFVWGADKGDSSRGQWVNDRGTDFRGTACV